MDTKKPQLMKSQESPRPRNGMHRTEIVGHQSDHGLDPRITQVVARLGYLTKVDLNKNELGKVYIFYQSSSILKKLKEEMKKEEKEDEEEKELEIIKIPFGVMG